MGAILLKEGVMPKATPSAFDGIRTFHEFKPDEKAAVLASLGELVATPLVGAPRSDFGIFGSTPRVFDRGAHTFGYVRPAETGESLIEIRHAGNIAPEMELRNSQLWIGLSGLRIAEYPGRGKHSILFGFYGRNQTAKTKENLHFSAKYSAMNGDSVGVLNLPIFVGLNVGDEGVAFECLTVNILNNDDEAFLSFLDGELFKSGLKLVKAAQPAIAMFSEMALGITKSLLRQRRNIPVQKFALGLDFADRIPGGARLRQGTYIATQIPAQDSRIWSWNDWVWDCQIGMVVDKETKTKPIPHNSVLFNVRRAAA
jgi:hypothetical protein